MTNPISTLAFKALIALKGRNAIVFSCHRRAQGGARRATELVRAVLSVHGAPVDLVQCVQGRSDRSVTRALMSHEGLNLILATGGGGMVKAAYSSGTPAIGVGPGNAPAWVRPDADLPMSAERVVQSKSFDNGIICGSEHHLVVDAEIEHAFCAELARAGAAVLSSTEVRRLAEVLYERGRLSPSLMGQPAATIAEAAGIERSYPIRLLVAPLPIDEIDGSFGREKLAPVLSLFVTEGDEQGFAVCKTILSREGAGHTAIIHTFDESVIAGFGSYVQASRILVNSPASLGCIGCGNGLTPSLTLGAGTQSGNSTTDNIGYVHLLNIRRIARPLNLAS